MFFSLCCDEKWRQRCPEKSKLQVKGYCHLKVSFFYSRPFCMKQGFLQFCDLNQNTSLEHICFSFMGKLNLLKIQSTVHNIRATYLKKISSLATTSKVKIKTARYYKNYTYHCYYHHSHFRNHFQYNCLTLLLSLILLLLSLRFYYIILKSLR